MSKFTPTFSTSFDFDGDTISVTMNRLKRKHALKLAPYIKYDDKGEVSLSLEENLTLLDVAIPIIQGHVKSMSGLTIGGDEGERNLIVDNGKPNDEELYNMIFDETYFISFLGELLSALMENSFVGDDTAKKSGQKQSGDTEGDQYGEPII